MRAALAVDLDHEAAAFAGTTDALLRAVLPAVVTEVRALRSGDQVLVHPGNSTKPAKVPVLIRGDHHADLLVWFRCVPDSSGGYLAVADSRFQLESTLMREPLLRLDYTRDMHTAPASHWQMHAERGAFSHLLAHAGAGAPHDLASLHLPVGGPRGRPCLEDFLQFLVQECKVDALPGWRTAVEQGRERWRRLQAAVFVRDAPSEAVRVLTDLGYGVEPPTEGTRPDDTEALRRW